MAESTTSARRDWIDNAVDTIVDTVDNARAKGTDNVIKLAKGVVYGLVALVLGIAALILLVTILVRLADAYLPIGAGVGDATWAAHLFIGAMLSILGFGLWLSRKSESMRWVGTAALIDFLIVVAIVCYGIIDAFA